MARYGRGQPHQPILLRGAPAPLLAAAVTVVSLAGFRPSQPRPRGEFTYLRAPQTAAAAAPQGAPQIHVVLAAQETPVLRLPLRRATVAYVRPSRTSVVPDRLAPQIIIVSLTTERRQTEPRQRDVIQLRNAAAPVAAAATPQPKVFGQADAVRPRPVHAAQLRNPQAPVAVQAGAPQPKIVLQPRERAVQRGAVEFIRAPTVTAPALGAPQPKVISLAAERVPTVRRVTVLYLRPSRAAVVPDRARNQFHVLLVRHRRPDPDVMARLVLRGAPPVAVVSIGLTYWQSIDRQSLAADIGETGAINTTVTGRTRLDG